MSRRPFSHLTSLQRMQIEKYLSSGFSQRKIAGMLGVNPSTISREVRRNRDQESEYAAPVAENKASVRRRKASLRPRKVTDRHIEHIQERMYLGESPDVISHRAPPHLRLSTTWIYEVADRQIQLGDEDDEWKDSFLRKYKPRHGRKRKAAGVSLIPQRQDIDKRPAHVETRKQFGHWEADTVIGKNHEGTVLTLVERKTRFLVSCPLRNKSKVEVAAAIVRELMPMKEGVRSITFDNGGEFAAHMQVKERLGCDTFFAKPYRSYERGSNENANGLLRRYYPKNSKLVDLDRDWFDYTIFLINSQRRKILNYASAQERFDMELANLRRQAPT